MPNLAPYHEMSQEFQDSKGNFYLSPNTLDLFRGKPQALLTYSFLCSQYDYLRKHSFSTARHLQRRTGIGNVRSIDRILKYLVKMKLIEAKGIDGIEKDCYRLYFLE